MDAETAEVSGIRPKMLLAVGETYELPGSGRQKWRIRRCEGGHYSCTCGAWQFSKELNARRRTCRHLLQTLGKEYESVRTRLEDSINGSSLSSEIASSSSSTSSPNARLTGGSSKRKIHAVRSACADESDYGKFRDSQEWRSEQIAEQSLRIDPWTGHTTFNGRALRKNFKADTAVAMMLSEPWDMDKMDPTGWWMSEKLDGCRAYWTGERLISRSNQDWKPPEWFIKKLPRSFPLDGELWRERDGFEELSSMCRRSDSASWQTISYFIFDAPGLDLPYEERLEALRAKIPDGEMTPDEVLQGKFGGRIAALPIVQCESKEHLENYLDDVRALGGEGVMLRRRNSPYERKRSFHSRKVKAWYDAEAQVVGYAPGEGRYHGQMGSLGLLMECGTIFTCGSGLTDAMRKGWLPPKGTIVRYRFHDLTQDGWPRFPVYVGICHDRNAPKDAVVKSAKVRTAKKAQLDEQRRGNFERIELSALLSDRPADKKSRTK